MKNVLHIMFCVSGPEGPNLETLPCNLSLHRLCSRHPKPQTQWGVPIGTHLAMILIGTHLTTQQMGHTLALVSTLQVVESDKLLPSPHELVLHRKWGLSREGQTAITFERTYQKNTVVKCLQWKFLHWWLANWNRCSTQQRQCYEQLHCFSWCSPNSTFKSHLRKWKWQGGGVWKPISWL